MAIYIAGPMSGYEELNFPAFRSAAKRLRDAGFKVISPHEINPDLNADWLECMQVDMEAVKSCTGIYFLKGWKESPGANIEYWTAKKYGLNMIYEEESHSECYYDTERNKPLDLLSD